jgi:hypothetical protein
MQNSRELRSSNNETKDPQLKTKLPQLMLKLLTHKLAPERETMSVEIVHARGCWPADCARDAVKISKSWKLGEIRKLV